MIWAFLVGALIIVGIGIVWFLITPYDGPPEDAIERLKWQAERGSGWAQQVLLLMEGNHHLFEIINAYKAVVADADIELTNENPTHAALDQTMDDLHKWIARAYNKEEC